MNISRTQRHQQSAVCNSHVSHVTPTDFNKADLVGLWRDTQENLPSPKPLNNCQFDTTNETKPKSSTGEISNPKNILFKHEKVQLSDRSHIWNIYVYITSYLPAMLSAKHIRLFIRDSTALLTPRASEKLKPVNRTKTSWWTAQDMTDLHLGKVLVSGP
jgi:hypothetical protein